MPPPVVPPPQALKRIRLAEVPDEAGAKRVWHSTGAGVDLVTQVDDAGNAVHQELSFGGGRLVEWAPDRGVRTGHEEVLEFKSGRAGHSRFRFHQPPSPEVLVAALEAVGHAGEDRYLQHLRHVCVNALEALEASGFGQVTIQKPPRVDPAPPRWLAFLRRIFGR